jgi:hypothetical protein
MPAKIRKQTFGVSLCGHATAILENMQVGRQRVGIDAIGVPRSLRGGCLLPNSSKEALLLWRPPVGHATTISPSPLALAANGLA